MATHVKKEADKGIDGRLYFHDDKGGKSKQIILSAKAGEHMNAAQVRDLRGVIEREKAEIGESVPRIFLARKLAVITVTTIDIV